MALTFSDMWANHPYPTKPCDETFVNQCAIRFSEALHKSGVDTSSFDELYPGRRCWFGHSPGHILAAQELANWLVTKPDVFGIVKKYKRVTSSDFNGKRGIVFIMNGWGSTDHIDLWDGPNRSMKAGSANYFARGQEVWFWNL